MGQSPVIEAVVAPSDTEIRSQLARVLSSAAFDASARNRNFLSYVVEETVAGRAGYIKGYTVAQSVFGRSADFDPQLDPVVRIEASRLRRSLARGWPGFGISPSCSTSWPHIALGSQGLRSL